MPRKRDGVITESLTELERLEEEYRGKPEVARVSALRLMKLEPRRPIEEIAGMVGYSYATVKRWLKTYREGGMGTLLDRQYGGKAMLRTDGGISVLKQRLLAGDIQTLEEASAWIEEYRRSAGTRRYAQQPLQVRRKPTPAKGDAGVTDSAAADLHDSVVEATARLVRGIAEMPTMGTLQSWLLMLQSVIIAITNDVDRVTVSANQYCYHPDRTDSIPKLAFANDARVVEPIGDDEANNDLVHIERVLTSLRQSGLAVERFRPPVGYVYYLHENVYLGAIMLWREREKTPISERTLALMDHLERVFVFILSDFVVRHRAQWPLEYTTHEMTDRLATEFALTVQEARVLRLMLMGRSYERIAELLSISLNTVRTHMKAIYTKSGTRGQSDFMFRYLTPHSGKHERRTPNVTASTSRGTKKRKPTKKRKQSS